MSTETVSATSNFDAAGFEQLLAARAEPDWLQESRKQAWKQYEESDWPDRKQEDWMRSDLRGFKLGKYSLPHAEETRTPEEAGVPCWLAEGVDLAGVGVGPDGDDAHHEPPSTSVVEDLVLVLVPRGEVGNGDHWLVASPPDEMFVLAV